MIGKLGSMRFYFSSLLALGLVRLETNQFGGSMIKRFPLLDPSIMT